MVPILSLYAKKLGSTVEMAGLIVGAYSIVHVPASVVFGRIIDKVGRKLPLIIGLASDAVSMILYTVSMNPLHLLITRILHGLGGAFVGPSTMSFMVDLAQDTEKGKLMGVYGASIAASVLIAFMLSGVVVSNWGYSSLFHLLLIALGFTVLISLFISETRMVEARRRTTLWETFHTFKALFGRRGLAASYYSIFAQYFTLGSITTLFPLYVKRYGMAEFSVAILFSSFALLFILLQYPSGILSDKIGRKTPLVLGLSMVMIAILSIPLLKDLRGLVLMMMLYGIGSGIIFPTTSALVADETEEDERGIATGVFYAGIVGGVAVGAPITGLVAATWGISLGLVSSFVAPFIAILAVLILS